LKRHGKEPVLLGDDCRDGTGNGTEPVG